MLYLVAIVFPPAAVFACGKPFQAIIINIPLCLLFYFPGMIHAMAVVSAYHTRGHGSYNNNVNTVVVNVREGRGRRRRYDEDDDDDDYDDRPRRRRR